MSDKDWVSWYHENFGDKRQPKTKEEVLVAMIRDENPDATKNLSDKDVKKFTSGRYDGPDYQDRKNSDVLENEVKSYGQRQRDPNQHGNPEREFDPKKDFPNPNNVNDPNPPAKVWTPQELKAEDERIKQENAKIQQENSTIGGADTNGYRPPVQDAPAADGNFIGNFARQTYGRVADPDITAAPIVDKDEKTKILKAYEDRLGNMTNPGKADANYVYTSENGVVYTATLKPGQKLGDTEVGKSIIKMHSAEFGKEIDTYNKDVAGIQDNLKDMIKNPNYSSDAIKGYSDEMDKFLEASKEKFNKRGTVVSTDPNKPTTLQAGDGIPLQQALAAGMHPSHHPITEYVQKTESNTVVASNGRGIESNGQQFASLDVEKYKNNAVTGGQEYELGNLRPAAVGKGGASQGAAIG